MKIAMMGMLAAVLTGWFAAGARAQDPDSVALAQNPDSVAVADSLQVAAPAIEYRLLATNLTSTMELELNEAARAGFRIDGMIGGETSFGGNEIVAILRRDAPGPATAARDPRYHYKVLATNLTTTMEREMQAAGEDGYLYRAQTVLETLFGGKEVVVVMEKDLQAPEAAYDYRLLATRRTSTMQEELTEAGREGFATMGVTVAETAMGGEEVVVITGRPRAPAQADSVE